MNVASDVVQLGQPPNGTGGKKNGIEKVAQKISETNRDRPSAGLTLIFTEPKRMALSQTR